MSTRGINKVILVGNVGKDPVVNHSPSGLTIAKFTIATNERRKDNNGDWKDHTEWHSVVAFAKTAEVVNEFVKKGTPVYVEGTLRTTSWDDKESGQKKYRTEININDLVLLGSRPAGSASQASASAGSSAGAAAATTPATPSYDEEIPF